MVDPEMNDSKCRLLISNSQSQLLYEINCDMCRNLLY